MLVKAGGSLGFSIIGGTDHSCIPFGVDAPGIFISHVSLLFRSTRGYRLYSLRVCVFVQIVPEGIAAKSGKLRMGDRILSVNGEDITTYTHQEAVMALLKPVDEITLKIQHDPLPEGFEVSFSVLSLHQDRTEGWMKENSPPQKSAKI